MWASTRACEIEREWLLLWSVSPLAVDHIASIPGFQRFDGVEDGLANFHKRRADAQSSPIPQGTWCDEAAIPFAYLVVREIALITHQIPPSEGPPGAR